MSMLTHPIPDSLNTYGVRWLMPFRGDWFYGDALFIVDPWLWLVLGLGVVASRARRGIHGYKVVATRPARIALLVAAAYVAGMLISGAAARRIARRELQALGGPPVVRLMVGPRPVTPLVRSVVALQGGSYRVGSFRWLRRPHVDSLRAFREPRPDDPAVAAAAATPLGRRFLGWARFPIVQVQATPNGGSLVHLIDLRYADRPGAGFGSVTVAVVIPRTASEPRPDTAAPSLPAGPAARTR
jgi:inner membrane protein